jgi:hypothetical protein
VVLFVVTLLVFAGSAVAAARLYPRSGAPESLAERGVATALIATAIIESVVYALGWSGRLAAAPMALSAIALALGSAAAAWGTAAHAERTGLRADLLALVTGPFALLRGLARVRSVATLGYLWVLGLAAWTGYVAWLAPSGAWDGLWYHEPMVGFALQNRGFAIVPLPPGLEMINGYPRAVENLMLWASALYDRRLIDVVPSFAILVALLGVFTLARRHGATQPASVGLAVVAVTIPGAVLELRSTYVDLSVLAATVLALHFVSRPELRARDVWMAGLALGILGAIKANGALFAAILGAWLLVRAIVRLEGKLVLHVLGGFLLAAAMALPTYVRNQLLHANPIWPITYESQLLGVRFEGTIDAGHMQRGFDYVWNELVGPPQIGENYHDTGRHAYGYALPFVAAPLLLVAAPALVRAWLGSLRDATRRRGLTALLFCLAFGLLVQLASPGHHWARFSLAFPAVALVVIGWWLAARPRARLEEGALGAMLVLNAATLWWAVPAWDVTVSEALDLAGMSLAERNLASTSLCLLPPDTRRRRDLELGPGDVGAFTDDIGFVGNLWNDDFSNRVIFVPYESREAFLARLDAERATWVYVRNDSLEARALAGAPDTWARVGPASFDDEIYARREPASAAEADAAPAP